MPPTREGSPSAACARAVPDLTIIVNHIGGLVRIGSYANRDDDVLPTWRRVPMSS